jgi:hypothetical protein
VKDIFYILILFLIGCRKEAPKEVVAKPCFPVKSTVYSFSGIPVDSISYKVENKMITEFNGKDILYKFTYSGEKLIKKEFILTNNGAVIDNLIFEYEYDVANNLKAEKGFLKNLTGTLSPYSLKEFESDGSGLIKKLIYKEDPFLLGNFKFVSGYSFIIDGRGNYSGMNSLNEDGSIKTVFQLTYDENLNKFPLVHKNYHAIDQIDLISINILLFTTKNYLKEINIVGGSKTSYEVTVNADGYASQIKRGGLPFLTYAYDCK